MTQNQFMMACMSYLPGVKSTQLDNGEVITNLSKEVALRYEQIPRSTRMEVVLHIGIQEDDTYLVERPSDVCTMGKIYANCKAGRKDLASKIREYAEGHLKRI